MSRHLNIRQDSVQCPDINGKTILTSEQTFEVRCDWVLFNGNCSTYTTVENCIRTCTEIQGCIVVTINPAWDEGCCIPSGLEGQANNGWITAWNIEKVDPPAELLSTGTFTIGDSSSTVSSNTATAAAFTILSSTTTSSATTTGSTSTTSSPTSTSVSALPASTSTSSPSTATSSPAKSGLSTAAKAGIGVGAGVGGLALLACALYLAFRFGRRKSSATQDGKALPPSPPRQWRAFPPQSPFVADRMPVQEVDAGAALAEVDNREQRFELGATHH